MSFLPNDEVTRKGARSNHGVVLRENYHGHYDVVFENGGLMQVPADELQARKSGDIRLTPEKALLRAVLTAQGVTGAELAPAAVKMLEEFGFARWSEGRTDAEYDASF